MYQRYAITSLLSLAIITFDRGKKRKEEEEEEQRDRIDQTNIYPTIAFATKTINDFLRVRTHTYVRQFC